MLKIQITFPQFDPPLILDAENIIDVSENRVYYSNGPNEPTTVVELTDFECEYLEELEKARCFYESDIYEDEEFKRSLREPGEDMYDNLELPF